MADWDVLVATPSRGRPEGLRRLITGLAARSATTVLLAVGLDEDDPALDAYLELLYPPHDDEVGPVVRGALIEVAPRMTLTAWTNRIVGEHGRRAEFVASLGDDHEPVTYGWDRLLIAAIMGLPGRVGIAYGDDTLQGEALPTAPLMSAEIPAALGYMCPPSLAHYYVDNAWRDLGQRSGRLVYMPDVIVRHHHPAGPTGGGPRGFLWDDTYEDAQRTWSTGIDHAAYQAWCDRDLDGHAKTIAGLTREAAP